MKRIIGALLLGAIVALLLTIIDVQILKLLNTRLYGAGLVNVLYSTEQILYLLIVLMILKMGLTRDESTEVGLFWLYGASVGCIEFA